MGKGKKCLVSLFKLALSGPLSTGERARKSQRESPALSVSFCLYLALWLYLALNGKLIQLYLAFLDALASLDFKF